jgi:lipid-A-disaccharide synthase
MLCGADLVRRRRPGTQLLVTLAPDLDRDWFDERMALAGAQDVCVHAGDFPEILSVCETGVVASGTASLEAAVAGLPIVVGYKMGPLSYLVGRALVRLPHIALPNLVAGRGVVPELIQGQCNAERVAEELSGYLEHPERARRTRVVLSGLRERLGGPGVYERAAEAILGELPGR